ncbi:MAG: hypothetical protein NTZ60_02650 [Campylobacterales bacterium]|nr:hypothetical protein [Campylobacterales bacterium]
MQRFQKISKKVLGRVAVGSAVLLGSTNAFALTSADFSTGTALTDMGLAAVAMLALAIFGAGFAFIRKMVH